MSGGAYDMGVTIVLVIAFAALVTVHVATVFGLGRRHRAEEAILAFLIPPLAPYWAFLRGMRARAVAWITTAAIYAVALILAVRAQ
ncbi:MAG: hypothetical protein QM820_63365 [Minicystis sp.]